MGLIDRFQALFRPREKEEKPATLVQPPARPSTLMAKFSVDRDRRSKVDDVRKMYGEDSRARGSIQTLARDATKGGFELRVEGPRAEEAQAIAEELISRLSLFSRLDDWTRLTLRDGDSFLEVAADRQGLIVHVSRKPTLEMHRWSDEFDQFHDVGRAFYWTDKMWPGDVPPSDATFFAEWQIVHARWDRDEGSRYGEPLFTAGRRSYKRMSEGELDIAIRRKTRAGMKFLHVLREASEAEIEAYKVRNRDVLNDPFAAVADFFSSYEGGIQAIQGDAHLSEIGDVLHHADTFAVASPVPLELIGYGRDINRDVLEQKKEQYDEVLPAVRQWIEDELVKPLIERQWLLAGIWPDGLDWGLEWKGKKTPTPAMLGELATALVALRATSLLTDETLLRLVAMVLPDFDVQAELKALAQQQPDEIGRMGALAGDQAPAPDEGQAKNGSGGD